MKVLLIRPPLPARTIGAAHASLCEPLELELLAGNLRDQDVTILDMRVDTASFDETLERVKPDLVGVSSGTVEVNTTLALLRRVKEVFPAVATIVGGPHATFRPEDFAGSFVNAVAVGQGVETLREVVEAREQGRPLEEVPGLIVNQKGGQLATPVREPVDDLSVFPTPDRRHTEQYRDRYYHGWVKPVALVQGSAGSAHADTVGAPPDESRIVQETERVAAEMVEQETPICMADDDALVDPARIAYLCTLLKEASYDQPIYLCARAEPIANFPEIIEDLAEVGLAAVALGLSGAERGGPSDSQEKALDVLHSNGIAISGEFEVRLDYYADDIRRLGDFVRKLGVEFPVFSTPTPYPGTPLWAKHSDSLGTPDWALFDRVHTVLPTRLPLRRFYAEMGRLYDRAYGLTSIRRVYSAVPWQRLPTMARQLRRFAHRLRHAHLDQESGLHN